MFTTVTKCIVFAEKICFIVVAIYWNYCSYNNFRELDPFRHADERFRPTNHTNQAICIAILHRPNVAKYLISHPTYRLLNHCHPKALVVELIQALMAHHTSQ